WSDDASKTVYEKVSAQNRRRAVGTELNALERQWNKGHDYERIEDNGTQNGALGRCQPHHVEGAYLREGPHQHRGDDREIFGHIVCDAEGGERSSCHQELFADFDYFD